MCDVKKNRRKAILKKLRIQRSALSLLQQALLNCNNELNQVEREYRAFRLRIDRVFEVSKIDEYDRDFIRVCVGISPTALKSVRNREELLKDVAYQLVYTLWEKR